MAIGFNEFIEYWASTNNVPKTQARNAIETFVDTYKRATYEKGGVSIRGFIKSEVSKREAKEGINPKTKEKIKIPAKTFVKVKALEKFKDMEA